MEVHVVILQYQNELLKLRIEQKEILANENKD